MWNQQGHELEMPEVVREQGVEMDTVEVTSNVPL